MMPFKAELATISEDIHTATNLRFAVTYDETLGWRPMVLGDAGGAPVNVAYYGLLYLTKTEASKRARQLLAWVRTQQTEVAPSIARRPLTVAERQAKRRAFARRMQDTLTRIRDEANTADEARQWAAEVLPHNREKGE